MNTERTVNQSKVDKTNYPINPVNKACKVFGRNLRLARKESGLNSATFGKFIGISTTYVGLIERGERTPSFAVTLKICDFFGVSFDYMLTPRSCLPSVGNESLDTKEAYADQIMKKQKLISGMLKTFDDEALDYIIRIIRAFKTYAFTDKSLN